MKSKKFIQKPTNIKTRILKILKVFLDIYIDKIPSLLLYTSMIMLIVHTLEKFQNNESMDSVFVLYLSVIGICLAVSSTISSLTKCFNMTKENAKNTSVAFFYAGIALIFALLHTWLSVEIRTIVGRSFPKLSNNLSLFIFYSWGYSYLIYAGRSIHKGLIELDKIFYPHITKLLK